MVNGYSVDHSVPELFVKLEGRCFKLGDVYFLLEKIKGLSGDGLPKIRINTDQTGGVIFD